MRKFTHIGGILVLLLTVAACATPHTAEPPRTRLTLAINPHVVSGGEVDTDYEFVMQATGFRQEVTTATFTWSFAGGGNGEVDVAVSNGTAILPVTQSYAAEGVYGLMAAVEAAGRTATASAIISIGITLPEREAELASCGEWVTSTSGGYGVTIDHWNISALPTGAILDLRFDTVGIPDRIVVEYPDGRLAHDTGWRGDAEHDGSHLYPGGVIGPKTGQVLGVLTKGAAQEFTVTVFGPDPKTKWNYEVRCRTGR